MNSHNNFFGTPNFESGPRRCFICSMEWHPFKHLCEYDYELGDIVWLTVADEMCQIGKDNRYNYVNDKEMSEFEFQTLLHHESRPRVINIITRLKGEHESIIQTEDRYEFLDLIHVQRIISQNGVLKKPMLPIEVLNRLSNVLDVSTTQYNPRKIPKITIKPELNDGIITTTTALE